MSYGISEAFREVYDTSSPPAKRSVCESENRIVQINTKKETLSKLGILLIILKKSMGAEASRNGAKGLKAGLTCECWMMVR